MDNAVARQLGSTRRRRKRSSGRTEYNTPSVVLERVRRVGTIVCDPCWNPRALLKPRVRYTEKHDGLKQPWPLRGITFVNPPYGAALKLWATRCWLQALHNREIVVLVPNSTETRWFAELIATCAAAVCWRGRLTFEGMSTPAFFGSVLFYFGPRPHAFIDAFRGVAYPIKCEPRLAVDLWGKRGTKRAA